MTKLFLATEVIQYQDNDPIVDQLTNEIEAINSEIDQSKYKDNKELLSKSIHVTSLVNLLRKRFNLNLIIDLELHTLMPAAVIPFFANTLRESNFYNGFLKELFGSNPFTIAKHISSIEKDRTKILNKLHNKSGYVDNKHARVGGYLSEVKHYLILNFYDLNAYGLTPRETTAVILHETGHAFHGLAHHHTLESTNITITDILNDINNNNPERAVITFKKHFPEEEFNKKSVVSNNEITDFYGHIALGYLGVIKSQMLNDKYDETSFENLADIFASRFNVGKELVVALNKIYNHIGVISPNRSIYYSTLLVNTLMTIALLVLITPIGGVILLLLLGLSIPNEHMTYDKPKDRYNRIKNNIVNHLKNDKLPKTVIKSLLEQLEVIDNIVKATFENNYVLNSIVEALHPIIVKNNKYIILQQTIENNLNNGLFIKAAQLSTQEN